MPPTNHSFEPPQYGADAEEEEAEAGRYFTYERVPKALSDTLIENYPLLTNIYNKGVFWLLSTNSIIKYDHQNSRFSYTSIDDLDFFESENEVDNLAITQSEYWLKSSKGIYGYQLVEDKWFYYDLSLMLSKSSRQMGNLDLSGLAISGNRVWTGTTQGLAYIDRKTRVFRLLKKITAGEDTYPLANVSVIYGDVKHLFIDSPPHLFHKSNRSKKWKYVPYQGIEKILDIKDCFVFKSRRELMLVDKSTYSLIKRIPLNSEQEVNLFAFHPSLHVYYLGDDRYLVYDLKNKENHVIILRNEDKVIHGDMVLDIGFAGNLFYVFRETSLQLYRLNNPYFK